jgi:tetratricopeptide (TPR) repeat protein
MKTHAKSMILSVVAGALLVFAGQSAANNTEFRYQTIDEQTVKVGFWNNAYYSKDRAQEIVFDKIAHLALQQGASHFELVQPQVVTDFVATSSQEPNTAGEVVKTMVNAPSRADRTWDENGTIVFPRYFFTTQVKLHKTAPQDSPNKVYNARSVTQRYQKLAQPFKSVTRSKVDSPTATVSAEHAQRGNGAEMTEGGNVSDKVVEWTNKSYQHLQKQEWVDAIRTASAAINLNPNFDIPYVNRATAYIQHGYKDKAQTDVDTALALNPNNALAINMQGYLLHEKGATENAMGFYEKACNKQLEIGCTNFKEVAGFRPDNKAEESNFYLEKSAEAMAKNRWNEVIQWSTRAIEADPENYKAYANRAGALAEEKRAKEALLDADQAIALNPNFGPAFHNRGHAYKIMGNARDAALEFEIACSLGVKESCTEFNALSSVAKK